MPLIRRIRKLRHKKNHHRRNHQKILVQDYAGESGIGMYDENMKEQIWYYILRKYFYEQMFGSQTKSNQMLSRENKTSEPVNTMKTTINSTVDAKQSTEKCDKAKEEVTKGTSRKPSGDGPDFLKGNTASNEFRNSYKDYFEAQSNGSIVEQNPLTKMSSSSEKSASENSMKTSSYESTISVATSEKLDKREQYLAKLALYKRLKEEQEMQNKTVQSESDEDDEVNDSSTEKISYSSKKEPSWNTVVKMMDNFTMMKEMFACGKKLF